MIVFFEYDFVSDADKICVHFKKNTIEKQNEIKIFEDKKVRTILDAEQEKWYLSIIDLIEILTASPRPRKYWNALKTKLKVEGSELSQKLGQLKIELYCH